jgi:hypothetical protein
LPSKYQKNRFRRSTSCRSRFTIWWLLMPQYSLALSCRWQTQITSCYRDNRFWAPCCYCLEQLFVYSTSELFFFSSFLLFLVFSCHRHLYLRLKSRWNKPSYGIYHYLYHMLTCTLLVRILIPDLGLRCFMGTCVLVRRQLVHQV